LWRAFLYYNTTYYKNIINTITLYLLKIIKTNSFSFHTYCKRQGFWLLGNYGIDIYREKKHYRSYTREYPIYYAGHRYLLVWVVWVQRRLGFSFQRISMSVQLPLHRHTHTHTHIYIYIYIYIYSVPQIKIIMNTCNTFIFTFIMMAVECL
jgi:hypothetical protein